MFDDYSRPTSPPCGCARRPVPSPVVPVPVAPRSSTTHVPVPAVPRACSPSCVPVPFTPQSQPNWALELRKLIDELRTAVAAAYVKPSGGIPRSDLDAYVRASLRRADRAILAHQLFHAVLEDGRLKSYVLGDQTSTPVVPAKILTDTEDPTIGEIAEALGWTDEG